MARTHVVLLIQITFPCHNHQEQRQKQIDALKSAMDEAQEKAMEEKTHRRIHHLQTHGHDVTQLKATYDGR